MVNKMIESDTIKLLRECDLGIKMGVSAIEEVVESVKNEEFKCLLLECRNKHMALKNEIVTLSHEYGDKGKDPNPLAKGMSWLKTNAKLSLKESDATIADLITDGCNMGVKFLHRYLNQYKAADEISKNLIKRLINIEEKLAIEIRVFL